jgi:hypothetical protein
MAAGTVPSGWVTSFAFKGSGVDTTIPAGLLTFLNILVIICMAGNAAAGVAGVAGEIKRGLDPDSAGGGGFKLSQVW